jgi:hypothetical protein
MSGAFAPVKVLKQLGSYAAVLYAFGFLAVHARLNALGAWSSLSLIDEAYLREGALFLVSTLLNVIYPYVFGLVLAAALGLAALRLLSAERQGRLREKLPGSGTVQVSVLILMMFLGFRYGAAELGTSGVLLADGAAESLRSGLDVSPAIRSDVYGGLSLLTIGAVVVARWMQLVPASARIFRVSATLLAVLLAVLLPFNFAVLQRASEFPLATISLDGGSDPVRGALLFNGKDQIVIRDLDGGILTLAGARVRELLQSGNVP